MLFFHRIERYLFRSLVLWSVSVWMIMVAVLISVLTALQLLRAPATVPTGWVLSFLLWSLPEWFYKTGPLAILLGTALCFRSGVFSNQWTVLRGSAVPLWRLAAVVLCFGVVADGANIAGFSELASESIRKAEAYKARIKRWRPGRQVEESRLAWSSASLWTRYETEVFGGSYSLIYIGLFDRETVRAGDIHIFSLDEENRLVSHLQAEEAEYGPDGRLVLRTVRQLSRNSGEERQDSLHLDAGIDLENLYLRSLDVNTLPPSQVWVFAKEGAGAYRTYFYTLLVRPFYTGVLCVILCLWLVPLNRRQSVDRALLSALFLCLCLYVFGRLTQNVLLQSEEGTALGVLSPLMMAFLASGWLFMRVDTG